MAHHTFIFNPGCWLGEGLITIQGATEQIRFFTKWGIARTASGGLSATQTVELEAVEEHVVTSYNFEDIQEKSFAVLLESDAIGRVIGQGIIEPNTIAWEFHSPLLEGFELYERLANGDYRLHAEYSSTSHYRTVIEGKIWKKSED